MKKVFYQISFLISFIYSYCSYLYDNNSVIIINKKNLINEIKTKNGTLIFESDVDTNFDLKYGNNEKNIIFHISNLKNLNNLYLKELSENYKKFGIKIFSYELNVLRIVSPKFSIEKRNLLITEVLYEAKYICKKIYSVGNKDDYIYFGNTHSNFKYYKKFTFNKKDILSEISIGKHIIDIKKSDLNFFDCLSDINFIILLEDYLQEIAKIDNTVYIIDEHSRYVFSNIKIKFGNKIILIKKYYYKPSSNNKSDDFKEKGLLFFKNFLNNFLYRDYDLEKNEITFYLENGNDIIKEDKENKQKINYIETKYEFIFFYIVVIGAVFSVIINYHKNKNNEYPNSIFINY